MLQKGTIAALKGHPAGIVAVSVTTVSGGALAAGASGWAVVAVAALVLFAYDRRCSSQERHNEVLAQRRIEEALIRADVVKARHRDQFSAGQQDLVLDRPTRRLSRRGSKEEKGSE